MARLGEARDAVWLPAVVEVGPWAAGCARVAERSEDVVRLTGREWAPGANEVVRLAARERDGDPRRSEEVLQ